MNFLQVIKDKFVDPTGKKRSSQWSAVRKEHLRLNPVCYCCGSKSKLQVHHISPFHLTPELELEPSNLITLCVNKTLNCHLILGHRKSFKKENPNVIQDCDYIAYMLDDINDKQHKKN